MWWNPAQKNVFISKGIMVPNNTDRSLCLDLRHTIFFVILFTHTKKNTAKSMQQMSYKKYWCI